MAKKRCFTLFLILCFSIPLFAFNEDEHNKQLLKVLFGELTYKEKRERNQESIEPLLQALYLSIDLFNGHRDTPYKPRAQEYLDGLKRFGVKNLPKLDDIDFTAGPEHQRYTHRGWDWIDYPTDLRGYNFQQIWNIRKQRVLLPTIDKIFKFKNNEMIKKDSFAALCYYIHILGDHIGDTNRSYMDRIPITTRPDYRFNRSGENSNNPTIYTELLYHLPRLFREQTGSTDYQMLVNYLNQNKNREFPTGNSITEEEYKELQRFAEESLNRLIRYVPRLLQNEQFFTRVFN